MSLIDVPLFDLPTPAEPQPKEKPAASLRRRQAEAIAAGWHPLGVALDIPIRLHPDVPRADPTRPGETSLGLPLDSRHPRCGGCVHRKLEDWRGKYTKCNLPGRATHGLGTDVRGWWPACTAWEPQP